MAYKPSPNPCIRYCHKNQALLNLSLSKSIQLPPLSKLQQQDRYQRSVWVYFAMAKMNTRQCELSNVRTSWVEFEYVLGRAYLLNERLVIWPRNPAPTHVSVIVKKISPYRTYHHPKASNVIRQLTHSSTITPFHITLASRSTRPPALSTIQQPIQPSM